jgi:hypothetical protein
MLGFLQGRNLNRFGARLALLAVALHVVLSFAHFHPTQTISVLTAVTSTEQSAPQPVPLAPAIADDCAICANIAAFNSLTITPTTLVTLAALWVALLSPLPALWAEQSTHYHLFQTRAPPSA